MNLLLHTLLSCIQTFSYGDSLRNQISYMREKDYQNTPHFKRCVSDYLENFLCTSIGAPLEYYNYYSNNFETEATQGFGYNATTNIVIHDDTYYDYDISSEYTNPEWKEEMAKQYHDSIKNDKNLLYCITKKEEILYQNLDGTSLTSSYDSLPEGYNFLLYFDEKKVTIIKDGIELDLYGTGYYEGKNQWYLPGCHNFPADPKLEDVKVYMAIAKKPMKYITTNYTDHYMGQHQNSLYWIDKELTFTRNAMKRSIIDAIIGTLL